MFRKEFIDRRKELEFLDKKLKQERERSIVVIDEFSYLIKNIEDIMKTEGGAR